MPQASAAKSLLASALAQWQQWPIASQQPPQLLRSLGRSHSNSSYLLAMDGAHYVLRITTEQDLHAQNFDTEKELQNALAQAGIAPPIAWQCEFANNAVEHDRAIHGDFSEIGHYFRLSRYLDGSTLAEAPLQNARELSELLTLLQRYQDPAMISAATMPVPISYTQRLEHYWRIAQQRAPAALLAELVARHPREAEHMRAWEANHPQRVLCHHDLNPGNILRLAQPYNGSKFALLDWEFASPGIGSFDFAALSVELGIDTTRIAALSDHRADELQRAAAVYRYLCEVYSAALPQPA